MDSPIKKSSSPQEQLHPANYSVQELTHKIVTMKSPGAPQSNHEEEAVVVDHHALPQDITSSEEEEIKSAKAEMGNVKEENERLKQLLSKIVKDYHSLHTHFLQLVDHQRTGTTTVNNNKLQGNISDSPNYPPVEEAQESDELLFSLSLGRSSAAVKKEGVVGKRAVSCKEGVLVQGLSLGSMEYSTNADLENDNDDAEEEEEVIAAAEAWPPSKVLKTKRSSSSNSEEQQEEEVQILQPQLKKARVSIRARVETPTMSDGCQWRKYGQKIAKGNPCPRAYYRCTVSPTCPVRKQVQRCVDDMTILITTYEGTHNHPLPLSATAMASTTSAAASMLQSCSSSSNPNASISNPSTTTNNVSPLSGHSQTTTTPLHQYYFPNSSISTCNSHPTITLDLTTTSALNNNNNNHVFAINTNRSSTSLAPRYSSSSTLDFSNSSSILPCNASNTMMGYYSSTFGNLLGKQRQAPTPSQHLHQPNDVQVGADMTIAAATKVIASNPCFRSALAAAITSFVGKGSETQDEVQNQGDQHRPFTMFQGSYDNNNMMSLFPPTAVNAMVPKVPLSSNSGASICRPFSAANSEDPVE